MSSLILYFVFLFVYPTDPVRSYELPPRATPLFAALSKIPLGLPIIVVLNLLLSMIGPWAAFRLFRSKLSFRQAFNVFAYWQGGPSTLVLFGTAIWTLVAIAYGIDVRIGILYLGWMAGALLALVWLTFALSAVTLRRKLTCVALLTLGDLIGGLPLLALDPTQFALAVRVPTPSMNETIQVDDRLLLNTMILRHRKPKRGEIVAFLPPVSENLFAMRIIGLPGETVEIVDGKVSINGSVLLEPYARYLVERGGESMGSRGR